MKTTLEIPDTLFRRAKSEAAARGVSFRELVSEALAEKLNINRTDEKPWMSSFGKLKAVRNESAIINRRIEEEFETIVAEDRT